jgi:hypothetical protein
MNEIDELDEKMFGIKRITLISRLSALWIKMFMARQLGGFKSEASRLEFDRILEEVNRLHAELFGFGLYDDGIRNYVEEGDQPS